MSNYEKWSKYYNLGWCTADHLAAAVSKGLLTEAEKNQILAQ